MKFSIPLVPILKNEIEKRLLEKRKIEITTNCWYWMGAKYSSTHPYGMISIQGRVERVHRLAAVLWMEFNPNSGLCVLHKCDNPPCFNPDHLFLGTKKDNAVDMVKKGRWGQSGRNPGEINGGAKLKRLQVLEIRRLRASGMSLKNIATNFRISQSQACRIAKGKKWRCVDETC